MLIATAMPRRAQSASDRAGVLDLVPEFNAICAELDQARCGLARGSLNDDAFIDRILDLFVRADSLGTLLESRGPAPRSDLGAFALDRSIKFLKNSLRENYEGIVAGNGYRFVSADVAFRAAQAWRDAITLPQTATR